MFADRYALLQPLTYFLNHGAMEIELSPDYHLIFRRSRCLLQPSHGAQQKRHDNTHRQVAY